MVCKHQLMVWNDMGVDKVPEKYILRRWCKNVKRAHTKIRIGYDTPTKGPEANRHDSICKLFKKIAYLAEDSEDKYERVMKLGHELQKEFEDDLGVCGGNAVVHQNDLDVCDGIIVENQNDLAVVVYDGNIVDHQYDLDDCQNNLDGSEISLVNDGNIVDHPYVLNVCEGNTDRPNSLVACDGKLDVCEGNGVDRPNSLVVCDGNMDVCEGNNVDRPNFSVACDGNLDVCEDNNVDRLNSLVAYDGNMDVCEGNMDDPIRDPMSMKRKGRPPSKRFESQVDKSVRAKKRKYARKNVKESNKKKQPVDPSKDGDESQLDLLNVIPCTVEMAPIASRYNT